MLEFGVIFVTVHCTYIEKENKIKEEKFYNASLVAGRSIGKSQALTDKENVSNKYL